MKRIIFFLFVLFLPINVFAYNDDLIKINLFFGEGCPHCENEMASLSKIVDEYDNVEVIKYEVWYDDENSLLFDKVIDAFDIKKDGVPLTVIGDKCFSGYGGNTDSYIRNALNYYLVNEYVDRIDSIKDGTFTKKSEDVNVEILEDKDEKTLDNDMDENIGRIDKKIVLPLIFVVFVFICCVVFIFLKGNK